MEKAMQLRFHLCSTSPCEVEDLILQRIISTFEKALCILKCGGHVGVAQAGAPPAAPEPSGSPRPELLGNEASAEIRRRSHLIRGHLRVDTEVSDVQEMPAYFSFPSTFACHEQENHCSPISALADDNHLGTYSQLFYSPATSGSNCFSTATYQMRDYGGNDNTDIMSTHASTNNSPIGGMEFPVDPVEMDPNFPFNIPGFFT